MNITIKQLNGGEYNLDVEPDTKIYDIKKYIYSNFAIPIQNQKLVLMGRLLTDEQTVSSYPEIKDGTKLNLAVIKQENMIIFLIKYFQHCGMTEQEAKIAAQNFLSIAEDHFKSNHGMTSN